MQLSKIDSRSIERYKSERRDQPSGRGGVRRGVDVGSWPISDPNKLTCPATINRELAVLSHLLSRAVEWGWVASTPVKIRRFQERRTRFEYLTEAEIGRLLAAAAADPHPQIYAFVYIALHTAMRAGEILSLRRDFVDLAKLQIHLPKAKTGARDVPISANLKAFLERWLGSFAHDRPWLFVSTSSNTGHTADLTKPWRRIIEAAGLTDRHITRHTLRHTAITHLVQAGVDLPTVQRVSGHKTFEMVSRYSHQNQQHVQDALSKLDARIGGNLPAQPNTASDRRSYTEITQPERARIGRRMQAPDVVGGPGWIRTSDQGIMSPLL
jgi:integrase